MIWFWLMVSIKDCELVTRPIWSQKIPQVLFHFFYLRAQNRVTWWNQIYIEQLSYIHWAAWPLWQFMFKAFQVFSKLFKVFQGPNLEKPPCMCVQNEELCIEISFTLSSFPSFIRLPLWQISCNFSRLFRAPNLEKPPCVYRMRSWQVKYVESMPTSIRDGS